MISALAVLLGLTVLVGWHTENELLIRLRPYFVPMQYGTAISFVLSGLGLLALVFRHFPLARVTGGILTAVGLMSMAETVTTVELGIDRLIGLALPTAAAPGGMPPYAVLAFVLVGGAILTTSFQHRLRYPSLWAGVAGTLTACLGLIPVLGYFSGVKEAYAWTGAAEFEVHTALGIGLLGIALTILAIDLNRTERGATPSPWIPASIAVGALLAAAIVWQALAAHESARLAQNIQLAARSMRSDLATQIHSEISMLQRMANRLEQSGDPPEGSWWAGARILTEQERYLGLAWVESNFRVRNVVPDSNAAFVGVDLSRDIAQRQTMFRALRERRPAISPAIDLGYGRGMFVYVPVYWSEIFGGFLLAGFDFDQMAERFLRKELEQGYGAALYGSDGLIYNSHPLPVDTPMEHVSVDLPGLDWELAVWPQPALQEAYGSLLPEVVLAAGVLMAALLAIAVRAKQLLEHSARQIRGFNASLEQRVAQRTAALVASNQQLAREAAERERIGKELAYLAKFDPLTGLPNRVLFNEHLHQAIAHASREGTGLAVLFLDLDNFKDINDTLGHDTGDWLLREVAVRLRHVLREADVIGRWGGDEFVILAEDLPHTEYCIEIAEKILSALTPSFQLGDNAAAVSTSIGIATFPEAGGDADTLIKHADSAMYQAKAEGRNTFTVYSLDLHQAAMQRVAMKRRLREALEQDEFVVYYQPKVSLESGRICGAEALLRWRHDGQLIPPGAFIPLTEETGLIVPIGSMVLKRVCDDLSDWQRQGIPLPELSVNVSAKQFKNNRLLDDVRGCLIANPSLAPYLELELTERVFIEDSAAHRWMLKEIESMGVTISIDDFGTGCSSFAYFRYFPIHAVKIDGSFIQNVTTDSHDAKITETVLDLAQNFQITVVAEGVETVEQLEFLRDRNCDQAQGYYFGRPVPSGEFVGQWLLQGGGAPRLH